VRVRHLFLFAAFTLTAATFADFCTAFLTSKSQPPDHITAIKTSYGHEKIPFDYALAWGLIKAKVRYNVDIPVWMIRRLIQWESGTRQCTINHNPNGTVDRGFGQLNSGSYWDFAREYNGGEAFNPFDPIDNLSVTCQHLACMYLATGSWPDAIAAYNMGLPTLQIIQKKGMKLPAPVQRYLHFVFQEGT
jgi:hypothetical protein